MSELPTADKLRELFVYDAETGILRWKISIGGKKSGTEAGITVNKKSGLAYRNVTVCGKHHRVHRVIWCLVTGVWPKNLIDHKDGNGLNNRWVNLREASRAQNAQNCRTPVTNKSGLKGATWHKETKRWRSQIRCDGNLIHLGLFNTAEEAHTAYCTAARELHGEFANYGAKEE